MSSQGGTSAPKLAVVDENYDPWITVKEEAARGVEDDYSPNEFYCKATNKHDHSVPTSARVDPAVMGVINAMIASKEFPHYRTPSDFIRDSIVHRIHYMVHEFAFTDEDVVDLLNNYREQARMDMLGQAIEDTKKFIESARARIADARMNGDVFAMDSVREVLERRMLTMREPYKSKIAGLLTEIQGSSK